MENFNLIERFYEPFLQEQNNYSNKAYKTLEKNNVDPSPLLGIQENGAGNIELHKDENVKNEDGKSFVKALADFAVDLPKDAFLSTNLAIINGLDLSVNLVPTINKMFGAINPNYQRILNATDFDDKIYADMKKISDGLAQDRENTYKALEETNSAAQLLSIVFQDLPYAIPAHKTFKKIGLPNAVSVPLSVGVGAMMGYAPDQSFLVNSETVKNLKELVKVLPDTPEEEVLDRTFMALEGTVYGSAVPMLGKVFKYIKRNVPAFTNPQATTTVGGSAAAGAIADNIGNNIISNKTENE